MVTAAEVNTFVQGRLGTPQPYATYKGNNKHPTNS